MIGYKHFLRDLFLITVLTGVGWAGTVSGNPADYNAAQVKLANGVLAVPANVATYTASSTLAIGSTFVVTLPAGFTFGSNPSLTTSGSATFALSAGGMGSQSATFTIGTANVTSGQTISLASFTVNGATALENVTPVANALPITMQAIGVDSSALSFKAFASDVGAAATFVGAIEYIDVNPPSNGTEFGTGNGTDSLTTVMSAIQISPQTVDAATQTVPILGANGSTNTLSNSDTATVTIYGNFAGIARAFSSTTASCGSTLANGTVNAGYIAIPNVPINPEIFFCLTGSGGVIGSNTSGFTNVVVTASASTHDFLSAPVNNEFPGDFCYYNGVGNGGPFGGCLDSWTPPAVPTPALSPWAMIGLAGLILLFGIWKLKARTTT